MGYVAFIAAVVACLWGGVILFVLLPMHPYNDNTGLCVSTSPTVVITTPHVDHNGKLYCRVGKFVKAVAQ